MLQCRVSQPGVLEPQGARKNFQGYPISFRLCKLKHRFKQILVLGVCGLRKLQPGCMQKVLRLNRSEMKRAACCQPTSKKCSLPFSTGQRRRRPSTSTKQKDVYLNSEEKVRPRKVQLSMPTALFMTNCMVKFIFLFCQHPPSTSTRLPFSSLSMQLLTQTQYFI